MFTTNSQLVSQSVSQSVSHAELIHGDCLIEMQKLADNSIDLILCDLPYGKTNNKWDAIIDMNDLWKEYKRVIKPHSAILLFGQEPFSSQLRLSNRDMYRYDWIWNKKKGGNFLNAKRMPLRAYENISVFYKKLPTYNPQMRTGFKPYLKTRNNLSSNYGECKEKFITVSDGIRYPIDIIEFSKVNNNSLHPTQKPINLLEYLILTYSNEGDVVLDNCMGSGSTGVACIKTNRNFIGMEIDKEYFNIAEQRINSERKNLNEYN